MAASWFKLRFLLGFSLIKLFLLATCVADHDDMTKTGGKVIFISFDGFRWDYVSRTDTPNFDRLIRNGVTSDYVSTTFITKTFPTHYTLVTGLYEESHGFVGNRMYDPELDLHWTINNQSKDPIWWNEGDPIWLTNQRQGYQSGVFQYPGSDVKIRGHYPTFGYPKYYGELPNKDVIDEIIPLFADDSINLGVLYFGTMDKAGHVFGPDSEEVNEATRMVDSNIGYLLDQLEKISKLGDVNIIITADHGMTEVSNDNIIRLDDYISPNVFEYDQNNPIYGIWPVDEADTKAIYNALHDAHPNLTVYMKADIPDRYHYKNHRRIAPILAVADEHWHIMVGNNTSSDKGGHGFDNALQSMRTFFVAHGPAFKQGYHSDVFDAVDFYPIMCHILGIMPSPNNGSLETALPMFSSAVVNLHNLVLLGVCSLSSLFLRYCSFL